MLSLRYSPFTIMKQVVISPQSRNRNLFPFGNGIGTRTRSLPFQLKSSLQQPSSHSGLEHAFLGYITGKKKATEVAHLIWQHIVRKGDAVVDATCGNGHDTLALLKLVADASGRGRVYGMDIQNSALVNTSSLMDESLEPNEVPRSIQRSDSSCGVVLQIQPPDISLPDSKELVELFLLCHSRMEDIVPEGTSVRLVAFNLGYLPGGDKTIITLPDRTLQALQAANRLLGPGGLISVLVYVGHPGGREEFEAVQTFVSGLSVEHWVCCKLEMVNRPAAPVLVLLFKK